MMKKAFQFLKDFSDFLQQEWMVSKLFKVVPVYILAAVFKC